MLFAFAAVVLLVGLMVPANAQSTCTATSGVNSLVRAEGYNELVGDILITCTGGTPTAANSLVPQVDVLVTLNGTITSRITATLTGGTGVNMTEALLLMDEPNGVRWNGFVDTHPIANCGLHGEDSSSAGPAVCAIYSDGNPNDTYDGNWGHAGAQTCEPPDAPYSSPQGVPATYPYGCGRPNVFQGRQASVLAGSVANTVEFLGVPYDPPAPSANFGACGMDPCSTTRTMRIVNIRVNGNGYGVASPFSTVPVVATVSISNNSSVVLNNTSVQVGQVEQGLVSSIRPATFLQCENTQSQYHRILADEARKTPVPLTLSPGASTPPGGMDIRVQENFATAFRVKNLRQIVDNGTQSGSAYSYNGSVLYNPDYDQNVPGAPYGTETGFSFTGSPSGSNPPAGFGTPVTGPIGTPFANGGAPGIQSTNIAAAGIATQGTRIAVSADPAPAGVQVYFPIQVPLLNQANGNITGMMILISTDANGAGAYAPAAASTYPGYALATNGNFAVYEVIFSDPSSMEYADILPQLYYVSNTATNTPPAPATVTATASFAPFYAASTGANLPSSTLPEPRFAPSVAASQTLYVITPCSCDLLFPWVVGGNGYVTSIVVDNTTNDPFGTTGASGPVTFNYYGTNSVSSSPANTGTFAAQTTSVPIPPGSYAVNVITNSGGGGTAGLSSLSGPFAGYVITQANFQFCHGVASISGNGIQPQSYIGLEMDTNPTPSRTGQSSEVLGN